MGHQVTGATSSVEEGPGRRNCFSADAAANTPYDKSILSGKTDRRAASGRGSVLFRHVQQLEKAKDPAAGADEPNAPPTTEAAPVSASPFAHRRRHRCRRPQNLLLLLPPPPPLLQPAQPSAAGTLPPAPAAAAPPGPRPRPQTRSPPALSSPPTARGWPRNAAARPRWWWARWLTRARRTGG